MEHAGGLDEVSPGAPEPVELGDHQLVPGAGAQQCLVKLGSPGELAGGLLDKHRLAVAATRASYWASGCWSRVETRA